MNDHDIEYTDEDDNPHVLRKNESLEGIDLSYTSFTEVNFEGRNLKDAIMLDGSVYLI